jgi:hypothetical protein
LLTERSESARKSAERSERVLKEHDLNKRELCSLSVANERSDSARKSAERSERVLKEHDLNKHHQQYIYLHIFQQLDRR